ncbi:MAG: phenylacetic acid degradation protein PaaN [Pseudomonadota bacterium]
MASSAAKVFQPMAQTFYETHAPLLQKAQEAILKRTYWSAYPEMPSGKIYGETAKVDAETTFKNYLGKSFDLKQPSTKTVGAEESPYGFPLNITYPSADIDTLIKASAAACKTWGQASIEERAGVALEILSRINKQSFLMANAVMHTSGQAFMMAFQAGGPHAQDRGLEAIAYAVSEMQRVPLTARWEKVTGKDQTTVLDKTFRLIPRGISVIIGCATFPTWNSYSALFASMVTGNTVIVKPHPGAILPLAITVKIARDVLAEAGFDPNVVLLAPDTADAPITKELVQREEVKIVDFTGSPMFGKWLRDNLRDKQLYTEEAGVNSVVIDSTDNFKGMTSNIAFSLALYTGQMCTAPQNIFVPRGGIDTPEGKKSFDDIGEAIKTSLDKLLGDNDRAAAILGAVQNQATVKRAFDAKTRGKVVRDGSAIVIPGMEMARTMTPLLLAVDAKDKDKYDEECFGPVAFLIATDDTAESIKLASTGARERGAITASLYSTREDVIEKASDAFADAGAALSINLTGHIYVNQSAAFSDYHVSGANPAGNASLTDAAFVANRFRTVTIRRQQ